MNRTEPKEIGRDRRRGASLLLALAGVLVMGGLFWRFGTDELVDTLGRARLAPLVLYFVLASLVVVANAWRWRFIAEALGGAAPLSRFVAARMAGDAVGIVLPSARVGGDPVRVAYLYGEGAGGREAFAGVTIDRVVETIGNMICTVIYVGVFVSSATGASSRDGALWIVVPMLAAIVAIVVHVAAILRGHEPFRILLGAAAAQPPGMVGRVRSLLVRIEEQVVQILRRHLSRFLAGVGAALLTQALIILMYEALLGAFGIQLPLPLLLMAFVVSGFARAVPTPAGLGALEAAQVGLLSMTGNSAELGFVVGLLMRLHDTIWCGLGVVFLLQRGIGTLRTIQPAGDA